MHTAHLIEKADMALTDRKVAKCISKMKVNPLEVVEVKAGTQEKEETVKLNPVYRIIWRKKPVRLFGLWNLPGTDRSAGRYIQLPYSRIKLPQEARDRYAKINNMVKQEESAVFLNTQIADTYLDLVLALLINGQWLKIYRWNSSWRKLGISRPEVCEV